MAFLLSIILLSAFIFGFQFSIELIVDCFSWNAGFVLWQWSSNCNICSFLL